MSNALRRAEGLDEDPADVIDAHCFAAVVRSHRRFVRDIHEHVRARAGNLNRYQSVIDQRADETLDILRLHLNLWTAFDDERPN